MNSASASSRSHSFHRAAALSRFALMENSFIPNSTPAIGRTSTPSSRLLRKLPDQFYYRRIVDLSAIRNQCQSGSDQSTIWRVKGAWWPSRSSKPLSIRQPPDRGRFDSYPLRHSIFDFRLPIFYWPQIRAADRIESNIRPRTSNIGRGGEPDVARANS